MKTDMRRHRLSDRGAARSPSAAGSGGAAGRPTAGSGRLSGPRRPPVPVFLALLLLCALPIALLACSPRAGSVQGTVAIAGDPAPGAEVQFFVKAGEERSGTPFAVVSAGEDGGFRADLPPGDYHVVARRTLREGGRERVYKGEYPGNPVRLPAGGKVGGLRIALSEMTAGGFVPSEGTWAAGTVTSGGKPLRDAYVYAYPEEAGTVRGPSFVAFGRTDPEGRFRLALREGTYRIVARRKGGESEAGAMEPSGLSGGDEGRKVVLAPGEGKEVGAIALHPAREEKRRERAAAGGQERAQAEIAGTVVGPDGRPVPGVLVMAYEDHRMIGRPYAISGRTGSDGTFTLRLPRPGKFYLGARSEFAGPVSPGEWVGTYDGTPDHSVEVARGGRKAGLTIPVAEKW